jgi:hypothetical protein
MTGTCLNLSQIRLTLIYLSHLKTPPFKGGVL